MSTKLFARDTGEHAELVAGGAGVDATKPRVSVRAAQERRVHHPGQRDIGDIPAATPQQAIVFDALDGCSDEARARAQCPTPPSVTSWIVASRLASGVFR